MTTMRRWRVDLLVGEEAGGHTYAEAILVDDIGNHLQGTGQSRRHPADPEVPEIGDEIAVARALTDLGHRLLVTAATDLGAVTHEPVQLDR